MGFGWKSPAAGPASRLWRTPFCSSMWRDGPGPACTCAASAHAGTNFEALAVRPVSVSPREPAGLMAGLGFSAFPTKSDLSRTSRRKSVYEDMMKCQHVDLSSTEKQPVCCSS